MRAIDADHLRRWILSRVFKTQLSVADVIDQIDREDTIEPERPKGKWVDSWRSKMDGTRYWYRECDHCGYERNDCDPEKDSNFCPNCGARMEGE